MAQKGDSDSEDTPEEEKGVDEGYSCKLDREERERPEFQALIREGEQSLLDSESIPNYTMRTKNYRKFLAHMQPVQQWIY